MNEIRKVVSTLWYDKDNYHREGDKESFIWIQHGFDRIDNRFINRKDNRVFYGNSGYTSQRNHI